jgi:hypothetical protein
LTRRIRSLGKLPSAWVKSGVRDSSQSHDMDLIPNTM